MVEDQRRTNSRTVNFPEFEENVVAHQFDGVFAASAKTVEDKNSWQAFPNSRTQRQRPSQQTSTESAHHDKLGDRELTADQGLNNRWPLIAVQEHTTPARAPDREDPWPELPEYPPATAAEWAKDFRKEHLRTLDCEQRGEL
jgi:hypothetical protein